MKNDGSEIRYWRFFLLYTDIRPSKLAILADKRECALSSRSRSQSRVFFELLLDFSRSRVPCAQPRVCTGDEINPLLQMTSAIRKDYPLPLVKIRSMTPGNRSRETSHDVAMDKSDFSLNEAQSDVSVCWSNWNVAIRTNKDVWDTETSLSRILQEPQHLRPRQAFLPFQLKARNNVTRPNQRTHNGHNRLSLFPNWELANISAQPRAANSQRTSTLQHFYQRTPLNHFVNVL